MPAFEPVVATYVCGRLRRVKVLSYPEAAVPVDLREQQHRIQKQEWPSDDKAEGLVHDAALRPLTMLLVEANTVLATLDVLFKDVTHAGHRFAACGLSTVVTSEEHRGRGFGRELVAAAHEQMRAIDVDLALFTCDRRLQSFYVSSGFQVLPGSVLIGGTRDQPFPSDQPGFDKITLGDFFTPRARAARESFAHARIELFPGDLDRLW